MGNTLEQLNNSAAPCIEHCAVLVAILPAYEDTTTLLNHPRSKEIHRILDAYNEELQNGDTSTDEAFTKAVIRSCPFNLINQIGGMATSASKPEDLLELIDCLRLDRLALAQFNPFVTTADGGPIFGIGGSAMKFLHSAWSDEIHFKRNMEIDPSGFTAIHDQDFTRYSFRSGVRW